MTNFNSEPYHINELGVKWWVAKSLMDWAYREPLGKAVSLKDFGYQFWAIEKPNSYRTFLVIKDGNIIYENQSSEAVAVRIDVYRMLEAGL